MKRALIAAAVALLVLGPSAAASLVEPQLHLAASAAGGRRVALTLDACGGATDRRILDALVENAIPATIFVTTRWLKRNPDAVRLFIDHPDLFEVENHGARHVPAVDEAASIYGLAAAGSTAAVAAEVEGGASGMTALGLPKPRWFRGAAAKYTRSSIVEIRRMGYRVAGYSLNADQGAMLGAASVAKRVAAAKDGDVIIAHVNQPARPAGEGLVRGLLRLKAEGATFVRLADVAETGTDGTASP